MCFFCGNPVTLGWLAGKTAAGLDILQLSLVTGHPLSGTAQLISPYLTSHTPLKRKDLQNSLGDSETWTFARHVTVPY